MSAGIDITGSTLYLKEVIACKCGHVGDDYLVTDKSGQYIASCRACNSYLKAVPHSSKYATKYNYERALEKTHSRCCYCGKVLKGERSDDATYEHVVSRKRGGGNEEENILLACATCNSSKGGDKNVEQFRQHIIKRDGLEYYIFWFEELWYSPKPIKKIFDSIWGK